MLEIYVVNKECIVKYLAKLASDPLTEHVGTKELEQCTLGNLCFPVDASYFFIRSSDKTLKHHNDFGKKVRMKQ